MQTELTWRKAIEQVLAASPHPLHYDEITQRIISEGLRKALGATPAATVNAQISSSIKHDGASSPYVKVSKGTFKLKKGPADLTVTSKPSPEIVESEEEEDQEEQYKIVRSFGMFWRREAIEWTATPKLLGMEKLGSVPVDFNKQVGVYLLYDGREVIYVGRTTDRPLGKRLNEHTVDRMSSRWDRFSWFGLLPVSETGQLGKLPDTYFADDLIPALEAILIEALEPRQNRKRGDGLAAVEYIQRIDPEIDKKKVKAAIDAALNKL